MKKACKIVMIICAVILVAGIALLAVALITGGSWETVQSHGSIDALAEKLKSVLPFLKNLP